MVVVNPVSGRGRGATVGDLVTRDLLAAGHAPTVLRPRTRQDAVRALAEAVARRPRALVAVGGDGMVHLAANALADAAVPTPLAVVPAGTGNDLALCFGFPTDPRVAVARLLDRLRPDADHPPRAVDALQVEGGWGHRWVLGVVAAGFDAVVNERANGWSWPAGRRRYDLAIVRELPGLRARSYLLDAPGRPDTRIDSLLLAVANVPSYGGGIRISPESDPQDGTAELVSVGRLGPVEIARLIPRVYTGRHLGHPAVSVTPVTSLRLATAPGRTQIVAYGDGERLGPLPIEVTVAPGRLRLLG